MDGWREFFTVVVGRRYRASGEGMGKHRFQTSHSLDDGGVVLGHRGEAGEVGVLWHCISLSRKVVREQLNSRPTVTQLSQLSQLSSVGLHTYMMLSEVKSRKAHVPTAQSSQSSAL